MAKKSKTKKNTYFVYVYAYDVDEEFPPIHGKVDNNIYDTDKEAKEAMMSTALDRFKEFELILLEVKDQNSDLEDKDDCIESMLIHNNQKKAKPSQIFEQAKSQLRKKKK